MGIQKTADATGPDKLVNEHLEEYLKTNKPKLTALKEFFELEEANDGKEQVLEVQAQRKKKDLLQHILKCVELTTRYTKEELVDRFCPIDGRFLLKHYAKLLQVY
ncbi:hypothetical protein Tco_1103585 [Tanacetum coccineum]